MGIPSSLTLADLKEAMRSPGCCLCRVRETAERRHLRFFIWEGTNDGPAIARLTQSWGLCSRHTDWILRADITEYGNALGTATALGYLLDALLAELKKTRRQWSPRGKRSRKPARLPLAPTSQCPVCESGERTERIGVGELVRVVQTAAGRESYASSDGVCLPHLRQLLAASTDGDVVHFLIDDERERYAALRSELTEYCRKHDYRFADETYGAERDSWQRAAWKLAGSQALDGEPKR